MTRDGFGRHNEELLVKCLSIDNLTLQIERNMNNVINSGPEDEQQRKITELIKVYKEKSTSGLPEARSIIKANIKTDLLTGFSLYRQNAAGEPEDSILSEKEFISEANGLVDRIIPFDKHELLTAREQFSILLHWFEHRESNGRDGAFRRLLERCGCIRKQRIEPEYESIRHELDEADISRLYRQENPVLRFGDKLDIVVQRLYEEIFGLMQIDQLAYSDINEIGFSDNGRYVYCWCGCKIWLSFIQIPEKQARVIQDRAISFDKYCMQLDSGNPEILCHRGDGARITVTQKPYFSARNLCIRIFNQSNASFGNLFAEERLRVLIAALVRSGMSICLQGGLGTGKTTTMNVMYELLDDALHIGTVEDYFEQHIMEKYPLKRIVEGQSIPGKSLQDVVKTILRMSVDVANIGEVRDGDALFSYIQLVQSVSVAAWFTTHITNPETTVPRLKNMLTGTSHYHSEQSAVMDIIHCVNVIFQHQNMDGRICITKIVEIIPLAETFCAFDYSPESDIRVLKRLAYVQEIQRSPSNLYRLNTLYEYDGYESKLVNYPSPHMLDKAAKKREAFKYMNRYVEMIRRETGQPIPQYVQGVFKDA